MDGPIDEFKSKNVLRSRRVSCLRKKAAPLWEFGSLTAWKCFSGMGESMSGRVLLLVDVVVWSVSEMWSTLEVELMDRWR